MADPKDIIERCPKPGCGALKQAPCTDWDCPQQWVSYHDHATALRAEARSAHARGREDAARVAERWLESSWQDEVFAARSIADAIRALPDPEASDANPGGQ